MPNRKLSAPAKNGSAAGKNGSAPGKGCCHIVLIPASKPPKPITDLFQDWTHDPHWTPDDPDVVLHYFDNLPTAAVVTRAQRLRNYLAKRMARGEIRPDRDGLVTPRAASTFAGSSATYTHLKTTPGMPGTPGSRSMAFISAGRSSRKTFSAASRRSCFFPFRTGALTSRSGSTIGKRCA